MAGLLLRNTLLSDGRRVDLRCVDGLIEAVGPALAPAEGDDVVDLGGRLVVPSLVEPHAHLDKALTAERVSNATGDLAGAIAAWERYREQLTLDDIVTRAERAARLLLANGTTAIRTHVDVADNVGLRCVEALTIVRDRLAGLVELQIVALFAPWADRALLRAAIAAGADVVGGAPHIADDPAAEQRFCLETAGELDVAVDLHTDEHLDPAWCDLRGIAEWVRRSGFSKPVAASHCCSLGVIDPGEQRAVADEVAAAGVSVVTLPQTNLYLQGRAHPTATPRGLTALAPLHAAGVTVAAGGDNLQDPFNLMGRGDPLETASLLVTAGHLLPGAAFAAVTDAARTVLGLPAVRIEPDSPADLVALPAASVREALAFAPASRIVVRAGRVVAGPAVPTIAR